MPLVLSKELVGEMKLPCVLVDMGSGNADRTRMFIDVLLQKQSQLTYIPVDVSERKLKVIQDNNVVKNEYSWLLKVDANITR